MTQNLGRLTTKEHVSVSLLSLNLFDNFYDVFCDRDHYSRRTDCFSMDNCKQSCVRGMKMYHFIESVTISLLLEAVSAAADTMSAIYLHADLVSIAIDTC